MFVLVSSFYILFLSERYTDKETSNTAIRRSVLSEFIRSAEKGLARLGAIYQFSRGSGRFDPGFKKVDKVRFVKVYKIRQGCRLRGRRMARV